MRGAAAVTVVVGVVLGPGAAAAQAPPGALVDMPGKLFAPGRVSILAGEQVIWRNSDAVAHHVRADDRSFDSGRMAPGATFAQRVDAAGVHRYACVLHRGMRGIVEVAGIALSGPAKPLRPGAAGVLDGRAPAGTGEVAIVADGRVVSTRRPLPDGTFSAPVPAVPATYRAVAGSLSSAAVRVGVAPDVVVLARRSGLRVVVELATSPPQPGAVVLLERHERERFGFVGMRRLELGPDSRARIVLRTSRRLRLRGRLVRPVNGFSRAAGPAAVVARRGGRPAGGGGHSGH